MIKFTIPIRTKNPLNGSQGRSRAAMFAKAARRKKERNAAWACCRETYERTVFETRIQIPRTVTLRRVSPRALDGDGLQAALKSVRDGIADALGINDGSDAVTWKYEWRKGKPREYAVEVIIVPQSSESEATA